MTQEDPGQPEEGAAETAEGTDAAAEPEEETAAAGNASDDEAAAVESAGKVVVDSLPRWFEHASQNWSATLGKKVVSEVGEAVEVAAAALGAEIESQPLAVRGTASVQGVEAGVMLLASEDAALKIAKAILDEEQVSELGEKEMSAFNELVRQIYASLEGVWTSDGVDGLLLEPGNAERLEGPGDNFPEGASVTKVTMSIDEAEGIPLSFVFDRNLALIFPSGGEGGGGKAKTALSEVPGGRVTKRLMNIKVPLTVEIARKGVKMKSVLAFKPGTVIEFDKRSEDLLGLYVGHSIVGRGEAVKVGESFGLRVLEIGGIRERIESLSQ